LKILPFIIGNQEVVAHEKLKIQAKQILIEKGIVTTKGITKGKFDDFLTGIRDKGLVLN